MKDKFFTFLLLFISVTLGCGGDLEFNFDDFVESDQKFNIISYEIQSVADLFNERFRLKSLDKSKLDLKNTLIDKIYDEELDFFFDIVFPLPEFSLEESPPKLLLISPRSNIERLDEVLLTARLTDAEIVSIEQDIESQTDYSSIIVNIGGIAAYPSIVTEVSDKGAMFKLIAHEWLHQYLFFFPLGRAYFSDEDMRSVNETLANIFADNLLNNMCKEDVYIQSGYCLQNTDVSEKDFDYSVYMKDLRQQVDFFLLAGEIEKSEKLMNSATIYLNSRGYNIRRINQAWFAFHGSYADTPASSSEINNELTNFISSEKSLGNAIRKLRSIDNYQEYLRFVDEKK
ncbi:MAG: hypothetical protein CL899_03770 [Dehalococcoidia bacterium]|nr:hypothetical protein [Dehalococcoidia bacterium]